MFDINQKVSKRVCANMRVQVVHSQCFLTKPTKRLPTWCQVERLSGSEGETCEIRNLFRPPVLLPHVTDHVKPVQVAHTLTLWADHLALVLVDHPEHLVLHCRVLLSMALEVSGGTAYATDLANPRL